MPRIGRLFRSRKVNSLEIASDAQRYCIRSVAFRDVSTRDHFSADGERCRVAMIRVDAVVPKAVDRNLSRWASARDRVWQCREKCRIGFKHEIGMLREG